MFTGLVEAQGRLESSVARGSGRALAIKGPTSNLELGESISVNGACLTVTAQRGPIFEVDVSRETLQRTTLGEIAPGTALNLERALAFGARIGGHLVTGHVDAVVRVERVARHGDFVEVGVALPQQLTALVAAKGSVALDGVSLTVNEVSRSSFTIMLIPHTLNATTLGRLRVGSVLNLEADLLARYVQRQLEMSALPAGAARESSLSDLLARAGFSTP